MFEDFRPPDAAARLRSAGIAPRAAFLFAQAYLTFYPLLTRVPSWLFWLVDVLLLAGTVAGLVQLARVMRRERVRGAAIGWGIVALAITLVCGRLFLALTFPWL